jgi:NAD-dependent DNA ligase
MAKASTGTTAGMNIQGMKALFHGFKDLQQLRIQQGNRLCANFYSRLGIAPGTSPDKLAGKNANIIKRVRSDMKLITDAILEEKKKRPNIIKIMKKVGTELISTAVDISLAENYVKFQEMEEDTKKAIQKELENFDIWNKYLVHVPGIGPAIAGGVISFLNIRKARYASSFWKYCGVDAMPFTEEPEAEYRLILDEPWPVKGGTRKADRYRTLLDEESGEELTHINDFEFVFKKGKNEVICASLEGFEHFEEGDLICPLNGKRENAQRIIEKTDEPSPKGVFGEGRGRLKHHLIERDYIDGNGKITKKLGLTFNPRAKTLFVGIMPDVLLKQNKHYNKIYWDKKNYYISDPRRHHPQTGEHLLADGHITMMARRYMAKMFLQNLWVAWKQIENLPMARGPYHIEKLGLSEHPDPWFDKELWKKTKGQICFDPEKAKAA